VQQDPALDEARCGEIMRERKSVRVDGRDLHDARLGAATAHE
jgi:hypothetical protein